jgi:hypothetical protein
VSRIDPSPVDRSAEKPVWTICEKLYETSGNAAAGKTVLGLIFIYNTLFNVGWTPLQVVYCIEILPIAIRARGLAIYNISVSLAGFVNQYLNPIGIQNLGWKCESWPSDRRPVRV